MIISGKTTVIAHLGYPTYAFKAPLIYNPWFEKHGIDALVVPMGVKPEDYEAFFPLLFRMTNIRGALVTMPHKVTTCALVDELTPIAKVAGASNAVLLTDDGRLIGDQFDGAGFVRGVQRKGFDLTGQAGPGGRQRRGRLADRSVAGRRRRRRARAVRPQHRGVRRRWPGGSPSTIRTSRSRSAARIRTATTSSSTRPRSA